MLGGSHFLNKHLLFPSHYSYFQIISYSPFVAPKNTLLIFSSQSPHNITTSFILREIVLGSKINPIPHIPWKTRKTLSKVWPKDRYAFTKTLSKVKSEDQYAFTKPRKTGKNPSKVMPEDRYAFTHPR